MKSTSLADTDSNDLPNFYSEVTDKKYQTNIVTDIKVIINSLFGFLGFRHLVGGRVFFSSNERKITPPISSKFSILFFAMLSPSVSLNQHKLLLSDSHIYDKKLG